MPHHWHSLLRGSVSSGSTGSSLVVTLHILDIAALDIYEFEEELDDSVDYLCG